MNEIKAKARKALEELTVGKSESSEPGYVTWRDAAVRKAVAAADAHPEKMIPERAIWEKFGLEY